MKRVLTVNSCFKIKIIKSGEKRPDDLSYNAMFLNVTRFVILPHICTCVFQLCAVSHLSLIQNIYKLNNIQNMTS